MADKKKLTVKEFKMWLEGVEEMQDADWCPNEVQWKRIREKIRMLDEDAVAPTAAMFTEIPIPGGRPMTAGPGMMAIPIAPSGNPLEAMNINPADFPTPPTPPPGRPFLNDDNRPAKTPNIDTSGGKKYNSSFT